MFAIARLHPEKNSESYHAFVNLAHCCPFRTLASSISAPFLTFFWCVCWRSAVCLPLPLSGRPRRKMVASSTLQRYPETFDLAASAVNGAVRGATVENVDLFAEAR